MKKHEIFKTNPHLKQVHMTSDGEAFYNDNDARMHAKSLKDKTVECVLNPEFVSDVTEEVDEEAAADMEVVTEQEETHEEETEQEETQEEETEQEKTQEEEMVVVKLHELSKKELLDFAEKNNLKIANTRATNDVLVKEIYDQLPKTEK